MGIKILRGTVYVAALYCYDAYNMTRALTEGEKFCRPRGVRKILRPRSEGYLGTPNSNSKYDTFDLLYVI